MPKIDIDAVPSRAGSGYPAPYGARFGGRGVRSVGDAGGLTQFGAKLVTLQPGAMSSLRHWHEKEDEFLVVTDGALTLVDDGGAVPLGPGDCCAFPAGDPNGHHVVNRSDAPGTFLVVGSRIENEVGWYPDIDMKAVFEGRTVRFVRKDGSAIEERE